MSTTSGAAPARRPLRTWPGIAAVAVQGLAWFGVSFVSPAATPWGIAVSIGAGLVFLLWWLLLSRAPWVERLGALAWIAVVLVVTKRLVHESIAGGAMGFLLYFYAFPVVNLALVTAVVIGRRLPDAKRRTAIAGAIVLACAPFLLLRTGGITGEGDSDFHWRWTPTPEERLPSLARAVAAAAETVTADAAGRPAWPGFRGAERDGVVRGTAVATDWSASPPVALWRRPIGPGWSSFAVGGELFYTQEQRGEEELVSCYRLATGEPVWSHGDAVRFYESNAGAGPRGTPALGEGRVYALGATGILNALDAGSGAPLWSRDAAADASEELPGWGFSGSPLLVDGLVVVAAAGRLVAYDAANGEQRWLGPPGAGDYGSPHAATLDGVPQVLILSGGGVKSVARADGTVLWKHAWAQGAGILQPALVPDGDLVIAAADEMGGMGLQRLSVARAGDGWTIEERWRSRGLKPYFNDFVLHGGHAYGFDNSILSCIDLTDGARRWKGGRYGHGQMLLLADQDALLVLSEEGELALVAATPEDFTELARVPALEGKTWNHPVLVDDVLLVRNAEEMAAYRLSPP